MPTFVTLISFTQKGIEAIAEGPKRLEAAKRAYQSVGAKLKDFYLVSGKYDAVAIIEAPDHETAAAISLGIAARGNSRTETLRAFNEEEYRKIVAKLPKVDIK
jgi:uncharacterized protein with GYD domain